MKKQKASMLLAVTLVLCGGILAWAVSQDPGNPGKWGASITIIEGGDHPLVSGSCAPPSSILDDNDIVSWCLYNETTNWIYAKNTLHAKGVGTTNTLPNGSINQWALGSNPLQFDVTGTILPTDTAGMHVSMWWTAFRRGSDEPDTACWCEIKLPGGLQPGQGLPPRLHVVGDFDLPGDAAVPTDMHAVPWVDFSWNSDRHVTHVALFAADAVLRKDHLPRMTKCPEPYAYADEDGTQAGPIEIDWQSRTLRVHFDADPQYFDGWTHWMLEVGPEDGNAGWVFPLD